MARHAQSRQSILNAVLVLVLTLGVVASSRQQRTPAAFLPQSWRLVLDRRAVGKYEGVTFVDSLRGWVVDARGNILHTADGGASWVTQATGLGPLRSVEFLDARRGFAGTVGGTLYATTDGGITWTDITSRLPRRASGFCGMSHVGDAVHIVGRYIGGRADYFFSPDAGVTWRASDLGELAMGLVDVVFLSDSVGIIGGISQPTAPARFGGALILRTTDRGRTWRPVYENEVIRSFTWKLFPVSRTVVYAALQSNDGTHRVAKTTDAGATWRILTVAGEVPTGQSLQGIGFIDEGTGWVGGFLSGMYATVDSGRTWSPVAVPTRTVNQFAVAGGTLITAGSTGILKYAPSGGVR